jgi:hypothetical protein
VSEDSPYLRLVQHVGDVSDTPPLDPIPPEDQPTPATPSPAPLAPTPGVLATPAQGPSLLGLDTWLFVAGIGAVWWWMRPKDAAPKAVVATSGALAIGLAVGVFIDGWVNQPSGS